VAARRNWGQSVVKIKIYVEGGGERNDLRTECRRGFTEFFKKAGFVGSMPRIVVCGSRSDAYADFCVAMKQAQADDFIILLVDSEAAIEYGSDPWHHLKVRDGWDKPPHITTEQAHFMVECMENWLLADQEVLIKYYGNKFNVKALPQNPKIEEIPKKDVMNGLREATRNTQKGSYNKGGHSLDLLARIDAAKVIDKAPYAYRLIKILRSETSKPKEK
jgi:hypothetical protein